MLRLLILTAAGLVLTLGLTVLGGRGYTGTVPLGPGNAAYTLDGLRVEAEDDAILSVEAVSVADGVVTYTLRSLKNGSTYVDILDAGTGETLAGECFLVFGPGWVRNYDNDNDTYYRYKQVILSLYLILVSASLWLAFYRAQKYLLYSYQAVFFAGLGTWTAVMAVVAIACFLQGDSMLTLYSSMQRAGDTFMSYTAIPVLLFSLALTVSNIVLIRREGFRRANLYGIFISLVMVAGLVGGVLLTELFPGGSTMLYHANMVALSTYTSVYCLLECFLIGSIICGVYAALHEPAYDKDYVIILGCRVRPDGTLYPLIRGRVDRAIRFYRDQEKATGKRPVLVPSGGKGTDEQVGEAVAMAMYLAEQGIPAEQILVEDRAETTLENMQFSKTLIEARNPQANVAFSTTNYHVFRSGIISTQAGLRAEGMGAATKWYFWPNASVREVVGMVAYAWKQLLILLLPMAVFFAVFEFVL